MIWIISGTIILFLFIAIWSWHAGFDAGWKEGWRARGGDEWDGK